jgi:hypothetical protein
MVQKTKFKAGISQNAIVEIYRYANLLHLLDQNA